MKATTVQIRQFRAILANLKIMDLKDDIVAEATNGKTTHASELSDKELQQLIDELNKKSKQADTWTMKLETQRTDHMRKRILSMCHQMNWVTWNIDKQKHVVDLARLDAWMTTYSYLHKPMNAYNYAELQKLVHQFETMFKTYLNK